MTQEKEILKKLFTIAKNQQKILTKLAQSYDEASVKDITQTLQAVLDGVTKKSPQFMVLFGRGPLTDGSIRVQLKVPASHPKTEAVVAAFKSSAAQTLGVTPDKVQVTKAIG